MMPYQAITSFLRHIPQRHERSDSWVSSWSSWASLLQHSTSVDQGTNQVGTSHQEAAPAGNDDVQTVQSPSEQAQGTTTNQTHYNPRSSVQHVQQLVGQGQNQVINFSTSGHIPSSAQKITPSV